MSVTRLPFLAICVLATVHTGAPSSLAEQAEAAALPAPTSAPSQSTSKLPAETAPTSLPIERQPYRIQVDLTIDPETRIDASRRAELIGQWQVLVKRFVGPPWSLTILPKASPLSGGGMETLSPESFAGLPGEFDKHWLIRINSESMGQGLRLTGREFDRATQRFGPLQRKTAIVAAQLPRAMLAFALELFNPVAVISGEEGGKALLTVRGAGLSSASPIGAVAAPGTVFVPLRITTTRDGKPRILRIPYTYLKVDSMSGAIARCEFVKGIADPLSKRWPRPYTFAAIGIKPGDTPLRLRFVTTKDKVEIPVAGYMLTTREIPEGPLREVGATDRSGRIAIEPRFARNLVMVRLLAGSVEPLFDAPMMPGESTDERVIPVRLLPQAVTLETALDSLRDEVVDLVALRARLEARMKARLEGENWQGLEETLKEFQTLTPRDSMADRLKALKDQAVKQQTEAKVPILTRTAQSRIDELQALIDRYLDDEELNAFTEALERGKAEAAETAQAKTKSRSKTKMAPPAKPKTEHEQVPVPVPVPPKNGDSPPAEPAKPKATPKPKPAIAPSQPSPF